MILLFYWLLYSSGVAAIEATEAAALVKNAQHQAEQARGLAPHIFYSKVTKQHY